MRYQASTDPRLAEQAMDYGASAKRARTLGRYMNNQNSSRQNEKGSHSKQNVTDILDYKD